MKANQLSLAGHYYHVFRLCAIQVLLSPSVAQIMRRCWFISYKIMFEIIYRLMFLRLLYIVLKTQTIT